MTGRPTAMTWLGSAARLRRPVRTRDVARTTDALETVYRQCHAELHRYVRSLVRDADLADDVLQTTMLRAITALSGEDRDFELRPWLFRIAHHEAIDRLRRDRPTEELDDGAPAGLAAPSAADVATQRADMEQLWRDLQDLGERPRQALVLRELNGLSHEEIGAILGTSPGGAKQTIFEARRALLACSEGRAMQCDDVQRILSDGDGRVRRSRPIRSHVADCAACSAFDAALSERPDQLAMLVPAAPLAGAAALGHLLHGAEPAQAAIGGASSATTAATTAATTGLSTAAGTTAGVSAAASAAVTTSVGGLLTAKVALAAVVGAAALGGAGVAANDAVSGHRDAATPPAAGGAAVRPAGANPSGVQPGAAAAPAANGTASAAPASATTSGAPSNTADRPDDADAPPRNAAQPATPNRGAGQPGAPSRSTTPPGGGTTRPSERGATGPQQKPSRPDTPAAAKPEPKPDPGRKSDPPAGGNGTNGSQQQPAAGAERGAPPAAAGNPSPPATSDTAGKAPTNTGSAAGQGAGAAAEAPAAGGGSAGRESDPPDHGPSRP